MMYIDVPYAEKDEAKALGARWNPDEKKWYIPFKRDYPKFAKWILAGESHTYVICNHFYVIVGKRICYRCGQDIDVVAFGLEEYYDFFEGTDSDEFSSEFNFGEIHIAADMNPSLEIKMQKYLLNQYMYDGRLFNNYCKHCFAYQGDYYLFHEDASPFAIHTPKEAQQLTIFKVPLKQDMIAWPSIGYASTDSYIKKYAKDGGLLTFYI